VRHWLEYVAVRALVALVRLTPSALVVPCGRALGLAWYTLNPSRRRIAEANLAAAFPARSSAERRTIGRNAFAHFIAQAFETLKFSSLTREEMLARVEVDGSDRVRLAYGQRKGVLFITGHFGFWELHAIAHPLLFEPIGLLARALDNVRMNTLLEQIRQCTGNSVIYRQGSIRRVMRMLQEGHGVAVLIDQHIHGPDAVYVEFFERRAATASAVAAMALRTGAPVVPVFALPLGKGRYRLIYEHPVEPPPDPEADTAIVEFTQRCTDVLEMYVRRHPDLWLWMHRRWRDDAEGPDDAERAERAEGAEGQA
jgi:Kdo2-lipid IVA lauroyltransferase/acyltransferase